MKRVVITGIGLVAPSGIGKDQFWDNSAKGISFVDTDPEMVKLKFKSSVLCRIRNFVLNEHVSSDDYPELADLDKFVQYGVVAGEMALKDAGITDLCRDLADEMGCIYSSAIGGTPTIAEIFSDITNKGQNDLDYKPVGSRFYNSGMFNYPAMLLAEKYGFAGPCTSLTTGCTAGLDAIGTSYDLIRSGEAKIILAGASEAPLTALTYATLDVINSLSVSDCEPHQSSRPFDAKRSGFVISEGAAVVVVEELEHALARGAHIYAEIKSFASISNAFHMTDLPADGIPMARAVARSLELAEMAPEEIDYINAHGSSTPQNDLFETAAYKSVFGDHAKKLAISSVKSMIGHSLASASILATVSVLGAIEKSIIHPTINYEFPDPGCYLDYVPNVARHQEVNAGMVTASGFGGIHSAAIFQKYKENTL